MKHTKSTVVCLATVMLILLLFGCEKVPVVQNIAEVPKEPLELRITWKTYSGRGEAIQKITDIYNAKENNNYRVVLKDGDEDFTGLEKELSAGGSSDIYVLPYRYIRYFGDEKELLDLTTFFQSEKDGFYEELWQLSVVDGKQYGIPWLGHSMGILYNEDLLLKAGVDGSKIASMEDLLEAIEKVEENTEAKGIGLVGADHNDVSWMVNQFVYGYGSTLVNEAGETVAINNGKAAAAIDFYKNTLGPHAQETWKDDTGIEVMEDFRNQNIAFEIQGPWGITDIWKNGNPFKVKVISLERVGLHSEVGPMMLALPADIETEKRDAALEFIRFLISKPAQEKIMDGEYSPEHDAYYPFRIPVRKDLENSLVFKMNPEFIPFLEGFKNPSVDVPVPKWQLIKDQIYAPGLHRVMKDETSIDGFLNEIEVEGNKILSTN